MPKNSHTWHFDTKYWSKKIKAPDWYMELVPYIKKVEKDLTEDEPGLHQFRKTIRHFFEEELEAGSVNLGLSGPDLDKERKPIDTLVIHHTSHIPGYRLSYMNAVHLLNIYAPYFVNPTVEGEKSLKGSPIWSGHRREGKPTFISYHWLMRMDGSFERLLNDDEIGWHCGNWEVNKSSIGICLDNDYEKMCPAPESIKSLALHIKETYPQLRNISGHCEVREGTICPGPHFVSEWKPLLLEYLL